MAKKDQPEEGAKSKSLRKSYANEAQMRARIFGRELKLARIRANLTQAELAEEIGMHYTSISQWERATRGGQEPRSAPPPPPVVRQLDDLLNAGGHLLAAAGYLPEVQQGRFHQAPNISLTPAEAEIVIALAERLKDELPGA